MRSSPALYEGGSLAGNESFEALATSSFFSGSAVEHCPDLQQQLLNAEINRFQIEGAGEFVGV